MIINFELWAKGFEKDYKNVTKSKTGLGLQSNSLTLFKGAPTPMGGYEKSQRCNKINKMSKVKHRPQ